MSDFDKLKRDFSDSDRVEAIYQAKDDEAPVKVKKPTVFSVLLATIKRDKDYLDKVNSARTLPNLSHTVLTFFIILALSLTLVICYFAVDKAALIPLILFFCPIAIPCILLVFYYEINTDANLDFFKFALTFVIGFAFYLIINFINKSILYQISFYNTIENYFYPILYTLTLFLLTFLLANSYKATSLSACFLIAVTLAMSYHTLFTLHTVFNDLFVVVKREQLVEGYLYPSVSAIVLDEEYLTQSVQNVFNDWFNSFVFSPYMFSAWAMVIGSVVSISVEVRNKKGNPPRSVYLLLMLVVFFRYMTVTTTTVQLFDHIIKILAFLGTTYVSVNLLNTYLIK